VIGYFDTSAVVPLLVDEPGSAACRRFWEDADDVVSSRLVVVEAAAALAQAARDGRLTVDGHRAALGLLDQIWAELQLLDLDDDLTRSAAGIAAQFALRGDDAVHCASAASLQDEDLVAASGDRRLLAAWAALGVATFDPNQAAQPGT